MIITLAPRRCSVVTAVTGAHDRAVIDPRHRTPAVGDVAVFTTIVGGNVIVILSSCFRSVVATDAVSRHPAVVEINRGPIIGHVAVFAGVWTLDMVVALARRCCSVVTAGTGPNDRAMIDPRHRTPAVGDVAVFTTIVGGNVIAILSSCFRPVVTTDAVSRHAAVIKPCGTPGACHMT